jgi:hypothetical protein
MEWKDPELKVRPLTKADHAAENNMGWYEYVIEFGPGSQLKFAIGLDDGAKIASISFG